MNRAMDQFLSFIAPIRDAAEIHANRLAAWFDGLTPELQVGVVVVSVLGLPVAEFILFITKTIVTTFLRFWGLSHPAHYRYWPRVLPWRLFYQIKMAVSRWWEFARGSNGSNAGFASPLATMTLLYRRNTFFFGRVWAYGFGLMQPVGLKLSSHLMIYAMSSAGKTTLLNTILRLYRGAAIIIDPQNQITKILSRCDKRRQWVILNPYDRETTSQWNPFDDIKAAIEREGIDAGVKFATRLAESLIVTPAGDKQPFWTQSSRQFVSALVMHILSYHPEEEHTLGFARELICHAYRVYNDDGSLETTKEESRQLLHKLMDENPAFGDAISKAASSFTSATGDTSSSLLSTLQQQTQWLDLPSVQHMLSATTRPLSDAKERDDVVFSFVAPVMSLRQELQPLSRLFTNFIIYTFDSVQKKRGDTLFIIDEMPAQGRNETLANAMYFVRSKGLRMVPIAQDVEGVKASYPNNEKAFIGNASATLWMASSHPDNLKQLSETLGKTTLVETDKETGKKHFREINVMDPEQVGRFLSKESGNMIVTRAGKRPLRLKLDPYFKALPVTAYDPDPDHKETLPRRVIRFFINPRPKVK